MSAYCCLPWTHLATHPHGGVTLCCVSDHADSKNRARNVGLNNENIMLDLNNNSVDEIINSDYFQTVRMQMLSKVHPEACCRCYLEEEKGIRSKRIEENARLGFTEEMARAITSDIGHIPVNFKFVELRLGNVCNVKCRTCNPASSTSWSTEYQKLQKDLHFVTQYDKSIDSSWIESDTFWDELIEHSKDLQLVYINGGEPTLVEKHWKYLERLIELGLNKKITLWYNINMTNLPNKLIELWSQFKEVQVTCSIDDLGVRNEYIRTGSKWETVVGNLDKLQKLSWIKVSVCQTISWLNVYYLPEFHQYMKDRGIHVHMNFVYDPIFLSVKVLPESLTKIVLDKCNSLEAWKINAIKGQVTKINNITQLAHGIKYNYQLDVYRDTKFKDVFPEWEMILKTQLNEQ